MEVNARLGGAKDQSGSYHRKPENKDEERNQQLTEEEEEGEKKRGEMSKKTWGERAEEVKTFLWNPETRQCMGRTFQSWALIILFYLILYTFLAGMFSFCLYIMLLTVSPYTPTYRDRVAPPGYQPGYGTPVTVSCKVQKGDENALGGVKFYPTNRFDPMYFPYYGKHTHGTYAQPVVAIQFTNVRKDSALTIQCQLNGKGIINDYHNDRFLGRIIFTLHIRD
ncbi:hypothetical protein JD844_004170 [Phrynosoma platyrhinos]|uniref:Protein ATP1B4 n=1 Tax=Phrynosoma platyrhinos TaxID=52577 RepID=A0ABQ7TN53_PHRPL|nr:hypothetical protein JD844_004170 [Phrynosoma platyrhinos]